jgi:D-citramalate synthase
MLTESKSPLPRVSEGEFQGVKGIMALGEHQRIRNRIEVLTFVDGGLSIEWKKRGAKVQNLLTKGSMNHLTHQLKKTPEQHFTEIAQTIALACK